MWAAVCACRGMRLDLVCVLFVSPVSAVAGKSVPDMGGSDRSVRGDTGMVAAGRHSIVTQQLLHTHEVRCENAPFGGGGELHAKTSVGLGGGYYPTMPQSLH